MAAPGYSKQKGSAFERAICRLLSLWISNTTNPNIFWRSSMSGGRATIGKSRQEVNIYESGDIAAISPEGYPYIERFFFELKHYNDLGIANFFLGRPSTLMKFWKTARKEALYYNKEPLLIVKENYVPDIVLFTPKLFNHLTVLTSNYNYTTISVDDEIIIAILLENWIKTFSPVLKEKGVDNV